MPRPVWSGSITFGLVAVPVRVFVATERKDVRFHELQKGTGRRVRHRRVAEGSEKEVDRSEMVKGYEFEKGRYVELTPEELEAVQPEQSKAIEVEDFVDLAEIDPIHYQHTYFLAPDKGGDKAYGLLLKAMKDSVKVAIGRVVIRTKEYLAAIRPYDRALALETMYFPDEIVSIDDVPGVPKQQRLGERELKMARQLIGSLSTDFDADKYHDEYRKRVQSLIKKKAKGETITIHEEAKETPKVVDLIEALKASVEQTGGSKRRSTKKRSSSRTRRSA
jgi:DNA end-binding protein Ku